MRSLLAMILSFTGIGLALSAEAQDSFAAGAPLELMSNTRVFGGFHFAESCSYDPGRDVYVAPNVANRGEGFENDGYISLINPDGTLHTPKFIGVTRDGLTLNDPLGSDIVDGVLYVADANVIRSFDMDSGRPLSSVVVEGANSFNDIEVADDGTIYATQTRAPERLYRVEPDGAASILVDGAPLSGPNGVAFDPDGNVVVVNVQTADVLTFSPDGELLGTEQAHDAGNDGLVILEDGTKYVSSVRNGTVGVLRPGENAEVIATGIPSPA